MRGPASLAAQRRSRPATLRDVPVLGQKAAAAGAAVGAASAAICANAGFDQDRGLSPSYTRDPAIDFCLKHVEWQLTVFENLPVKRLDVETVSERRLCPRAQFRDFQLATL